MKVGSNLDSKGYGIGTPLGSDLRYVTSFPAFLNPYWQYVTKFRIGLPRWK